MENNGGEPQVQKLTAGRYRGKECYKPEGSLESHNIVEELCSSWMVISVRIHYYLVKEDFRVFYFYLPVLFEKKGSFEVCMSARVLCETRVFHLALLSLFKVQLCGLKQL